MVYSEPTTNLAELESSLASPLSYGEMIATVISSLTEEAAFENREQGHTWRFVYGSAQVFAHLSGESPDDTFSVWSPVLALPVSNEPELYKMLLEKNWTETLEARFCIWNGQVLLHHFRTLEGISTAEITRAITLVASLANEMTGPLTQQFGSKP